MSCVSELNIILTGLTKEGKVDETLAWFHLKSPSLVSKSKLKLPCFFLKFAPFLKIIFTFLV